MAEKNSLEQIVAKVVSQVLDSHVPQLRDDLVRRVLSELPAPSAGSESSASSSSSAANLLKAIVSIHAGSTQREILRALLDSTIHYCERVALFVIKAGTATGWEARGFDNNDGIKNFSLDVNSGIASRALQSRTVFSGSAGELDSEFVSKFGAPGDDQVLVLPLLLKDKVAALVYTDAGSSGKMETAALEVLVTTTSAWLEVTSLRKQAQKDGGAEAGSAEKAEAAPPPVQKVTSFSDPFAAHAPMHAPSKPAAAEAAAAAPALEESPVAVAEAQPQAGDAFSGMSPEDADVHRKAQRFARLLVDEIKLYNQAKVAEGRKNRDLYDRMKDDIEKSRATYQKRYGNTAAAGADYFSHELVRSLAEDDTSLMGSNFRR